MIRNASGQKLSVYAYDATTGLPKTGDAANLTAYVSNDDGTVTQLGDTSATEQDSTNAKGYYLFDLTQAETNADKLGFSAKSSTSNIVVLAVPSVVYTRPANFTKTVIDSSGLVDANTVKLGPSGTGTAQTARDIGAGVNVSQFGGANGTFASGRPEVNTSHIAGSAVSTSAAQIGVNVVNAGGTAWATVVTNLVSSIWAAVTDSSGVTTLLAKLSGITSLAQWLGAMAGKQTANSTARTEIRASGAGSGTFDETTDSQEALRDRGDAAWTTGSSLDADGVRAAVGLAAANLDAQLSSIAGDAGDAKTAAEAAQSVTANLPDGGALTSLATAAALSTVDGVVDVIKAKTDNLPSDPADQSALEAAIAAVDATAGVAAIKAVTDKLDDTLEDQGGGVYGFTEEALQEAPGGGGGGTTDWDATERAQIRKRLGLDGTTNTPSATPDLALASSVADVKTKTDLIPASPASTSDIPSAATNASAVRTELATELGRIDAAVSTRATPAQVNTEADQALADVGLTSTVTGRIDITVSSRLAGASYTAPPSAASIRSEIDSNSTKLAAIDSKTSNLPSDPADQSAVEDAIDAAVTSLALAISGLENVSAADVKAQIVAALASDTYGEPSAVPAATATLTAKLGWLFVVARNTIQQTATTQTVKKADGTTDLASATVSDDNGVFERAAWQ